ncbi:hypothetical protein LTR32_002403 [Rachicladosporium monterosium]|uniref:Uncharacterized protein n=1 Tax=Rachicladosporium monterosium TaxID=1507873 RepID=A0ABR0LAG0_9PEZI|nr:hypothetical protein LTR32_002403 [Rachicladosporium monterosium]
MVTRHTARGTFMRMLRTHSGNLSYIPNQSRGLNLPEYDGGVGAQNEARIMKPEGSNGDRSVLWKGPKPVNQALVMRRRLVTMSDIQSRLITGSATVWTISSGLTIPSLHGSASRAASTTSLLLQPAVSAAPQPFETPSPSAEPDETASIVCPAYSLSFARAAAESPGVASPQPGLLPLSINTIGSPEDLSARPTCAKSEAATGPTLPVAHPRAASNEEPITLSSNPRSILLLDDVPLATVTVRRKEDDGGAALRCKPPSPLTADVSPPSEDDDETETETVRTKLDHVVKPAAVESDTDDGALSITNGPLSSLLAHKERCIRQTSIQQAPTPAILKTASRWYPHVVKKDRYAKGASQIERLGDAIRASYSNFGIDAQRLIIAPELQPSSPMSLSMSSAAKVGAKLTPQRMKMLQQR